MHRDNRVKTRLAGPLPSDPIKWRPPRRPRTEARTRRRAPSLKRIDTTSPVTEEPYPIIWNHSAGGIFRHDQESAAERIGHTVKAVDAVMAKKAPARQGCVWAGVRVVAALTRCFGIAFRTAPSGPPRPNRNRTDPIWSDKALDGVTGSCQASNERVVVPRVMV